MLKEFGGKYGINIETLSDDKTLIPATDKIYQYLDPVAANRTITLDTVTAKEGDRFIIRHNGVYSSTSYLQIKQGDTVLDTIYAGGIKEFIFDGSNWVSADIGTGENTDKAKNISIGKDANGNNNGIGIGPSAIGNHYGTAIGYEADGNSSGVAIGYQAKGYNKGIAIGYDVFGYNEGVAIGYGAFGNDEGVGIGYGSSGKDYGVAIGYTCNGDIYGIAIGYKASGISESIAIGYEASSSDNGVSIGKNAFTSTGGIAIGKDTDGSSEGVAIGKEATGSNQCVSIGKGATCEMGAGGIAIGYEANGNFQGVSIGYQAVSVLYGTSVGYQADGNNNGVSVGHTAKSGSQGVAIGAIADGQYNGIAIGYQAKGWHEGVSIGYRAGYNLIDYAEHNKNVLIGYKAGYNLTLPEAWQANTSYAVGDYVKPSSINTGYNYECIVEGTSGENEPDWPTTLGETVVDGTVTWKCVSVRGNNNIIIGYDIECNQYDTDTLNIGNIITGNLETGDVEISGKLTVDGLIDPTGLGLTPQAANPLGSNKGIWIDDTNNRLHYFNGTIDRELDINFWEKITEVEVDSDCTYIDFTGLDGNTDWFYIIYGTLYNPTDSDSDYCLFVEGDYTITNYYRQFIYADDTTIAAARHNVTSFCYLPSGFSNFFHLHITKDALNYFRYYSYVNRLIAVGVQLVILTGMKIDTITNITQLRIQSTVTNAIGAGSKFVLFKLKRT